MKTYLTKLGIKHLKKLNGFHNEIYQGTYHSQDIIIRISNRRSREEILEEIEILLSLKDDVRIAFPVQVENQYVVTYQNSVICFFQRVEGQNWHETTLTLATHYEAGKELGLLHKHLQMYPKTSRKSFDQHPDVLLLKDAKAIYQEELANVLNRLTSKETTTNEYGLIHGDYLFSNLLYHNPKVTIIDFDDIEYNYYLYDVAVYLFYLLLGGNPLNIDVEHNIDIFRSFMKGYRSVNQITVFDFSILKDLFRLRQLKLLATITTKIDQKNYGDWQKNYIALCDKQLKENIDFIDIPYKKIMQEIF